MSIQIFFLFALSLLSSLSCVLHDFPPTPALTAATGPFAGPAQQPGNALAQPPPQQPPARPPAVTVQPVLPAPVAQVLQHQEKLHSKAMERGLMASS